MQGDFEALWWGKLLPTAATSAYVFCTSEFYRALAVRANAAQRHVSDRRREDALITKMVFFLFFNHFVPLGYAAFWVRDGKLLRDLLFAKPVKILQRTFVD